MFLHNIAVTERAISADGIETFDLATNPLSVVLVCLRPLNDTGTLANFQSYKGICAALNRVSILHRGESIIGVRGEDLAALNYFRHGIMPFQGQHDDTDNERRCVVLPILLGRQPFDKGSCFPATKRGDLVIEMDLDIADTGYDGLRVSVETIELLDAKPKEYEKKVQITQTFGATGNQDVQLPVGGNVRGMLLYGTTGFGGASPAPSWGNIRVMLDNREVGFASTDFEVAQMLHCLWNRQPPMYDGHDHNQTANTDTVTVGGPVRVGDGWEQYCFLDYDPNMNGEHEIVALGKDLRIRANAETADAVRVIPIEVIKV
jgi:hypothetical protein